MNSPVKLPKISVITPIFKPVLSDLRSCLQSASVNNSLVEHILCIDGPEGLTNEEDWAALFKEYSAEVVYSLEHLGISGATNAAAKRANGDFLLFLDQDDFLFENWLEEIELALEDADVIYTDTATVSPDGDVIDTQIFLKPDWSPIRLQRNMYMSHFFMVKASEFNSVGGMRSEYDGSQDHDLALRLCARDNKVKHINKVLYAWRQSPTSTALNPESKSYAVSAGVRAVNDHLSKKNSSAVCEAITEFPGFYKVTYPPRTQSVSVVIPTAFKLNHLNEPLLNQAVMSLSDQLSDDDELIIVSGENEDKGYLSKISDLTAATLIHVTDNTEFNFSRRVNIGCLASKKQDLLVLNDDVEFLSTDALNQLSGLLNEDNVGLVGCLLLFPDGQIQHGGHVYHGGHAHHAHYLATSITNNYGDLIVDREVSGVTGAVMYQARATWEAVGGFTHFLPGNYNDVDYCLKVRSLGLSIVQANSVWATHKESATRNSELQSWEVEFINSRWWHQLDLDRYTRIFE